MNNVDLPTITSNKIAPGVSTTMHAPKVTNALKVGQMLPDERYGKEKLKLRTNFKKNYFTSQNISIIIRKNKIKK